MLPVLSSNHVPLADLSASFMDRSSVVSYTQKAASSSIGASAASTSYFSNLMQKITDWLSSMWNWLTSFCCKPSSSGSVQIASQPAATSPTEVKAPADPIQQRLHETAQSVVDNLFAKSDRISKPMGYSTFIVLRIPNDNSGNFIERKIHVNVNEEGVLGPCKFSGITGSIDQAQMVVVINNPLGGGVFRHHIATKRLDSDSPIQSEITTIEPTQHTQSLTVIARLETYLKAKNYIS